MDLLYKLEVEPYEPTTDSHNRAVDAWGEPVEVDVYGWGPAASSQDAAGNREPLTTLVDIYAPASTATSTKDRWTLPDGTYLQDGKPLDYSHGPFGGGVGQAVIRLKQITG